MANTVNKRKKIAYSFIIGDLFHYGHLRLLEKAKISSDYHICGVINDHVAKNWQSPVICSFEERKKVIEKIIHVDEIMIQNSMDPTENLIKIHKKYPHAKIILFQSHQKWGYMPGVDYIKQIGGEIVRPDFYPGLSREVIIKEFFKSVAGSSSRKFKTNSLSNLRIGDVKFFSKHFSSKANTLRNLKPLLKKSLIEKEFIFTVAQWEEKKEEIVKQIKSIYEDRKIVVRSSSMNEDKWEYSQAGYYESILNVNSKNSDEINRAVSKVISSYEMKNDFSKNNQVLIQKQTEDVILSGVIFTRQIETNTPYYLINYDDSSGKTYTVTAGIENKKIELLRDVQFEQINPIWKKLINAIREIESFLSGLVLDIEFAINQEKKIIIFQVRPLAANSKFFSIDDDIIKERVLINQKKYVGLLKNRNIILNELILSDMAFWNPAELIGDRPNYLDYSLFNHLIMKSSWNEALRPLGYTKVNSGLMVLLSNKPYVNVHNSFLGLLPAQLPRKLKIELINFYNKKLKERPELHDKVEFEIVHNCYEYQFDKKAEELLKNGFNKNEINILKKSLIHLTNNIYENFNKNITKKTISLLVP
ncbi:hypothetical protein LCGC14_0513540 [marine sediment metagenome]|uniref:Cytidyltransferase-like domain-containing protein n=1 Tax=marine sediment metagenome TaxID=412755 RepID=A0A0F9S5G9_9ZZZZ